MDRIKTFLSEIRQLEVVEFIGVLKMTKIDLVEGETVKDFEVVMNELLNKFSTYTARQQKNLLKIVKQANKQRKKVEKNGPST